MELNDKQKEALELVKEGKNIFITGSAGTGKSFLLQFITKYLSTNSKSNLVSEVSKKERKKS